MVRINEEYTMTEVKRMPRLREIESAITTVLSESPGITLREIQVKLRSPEIQDVSSDVYGCLSRMKGKGLARKLIKDQGGPNERIIYRLTSKGSGDKSETDTYGKWVSTQLLST